MTERRNWTEEEEILALCLYYELPNLFIWISKACTQRRLKSIDGKLEKLTEEWGKETFSEN